MKDYEFILKNLECANCANKIQIMLSKNEKLQDVVVNFNTLKLKYKTEELTPKEIEKLIKNIEPEIELVEEKEKKVKPGIKKQVIRLTIGVLVALIGFFNPINNFSAKVFLILGYSILLFRTIKNAYKLLIQSHTINENFLVTISCVGAYLIGEVFEGFMVILLYEIGKILEEKAINKTRKSIVDLMDIKPEYANLKVNSEIRQVDPQGVKVGDIIIIKQGEKIPLDGVVIKGKASLNMVSLIGESKLKEVREKDEVLSGSIVEQGLLEVKVTKTYENSTVNRILELVEHATDKKAKTETFVNKAARIYTPIVFILAILISIILPLITKITLFGENGSVYRALIFLVISCPCAIAISVPLSYFSGIGKASKKGILIKGSSFLDSAKDIKEIVFDKTGTLTKGELNIKKIESLNNNFNKDDILKYAVIGEQYSNHPIAKCIIKNQEIPLIKISEFKEIPGEGISYKLDNSIYFVGTIKEEKNEDVTSKVYVKKDGITIGGIYLEDIIKEGVKDDINSLKQMKIKTDMFTGDNKNIAIKIAKELNIDDVKYEMLPQDKYQEFEKLLNKDYKVAFVGEGINDSPVLARADIGIAMGGLGASSAIEASDVVIMTDEIVKIKEFILISKYTNKIIKQNLIFAIGIKALVLILSTVGITHMWQAVFADVGVTLITILNTLRILKVR